MMDFIMAPTITGIVFLGIYKLFELFVRRRERLIMIEKMSEKFDPSMIEDKLNFANQKSTPFVTLKFACLFLGIGLGLLVGFLIAQLYFPEQLNGKSFESYNAISESLGIVYGSSTLLFGGLGLLIAFLIEMRMTKK
jgi:hypothetical protein